MRKENRELYEFGDFRLDVAERKLERIDGSQCGVLPEKAFQTLVHLIRNGGSLVTKEELLEAVWADSIVEENNLSKAIWSIRNHLNKLGSGETYIETVPKHGYRFVVPVRALAPRNGPVDKPQHKATAIGPEWFRRFFAAAAAAVVIGGIIWIVVGSSGLAHDPGSAGPVRDSAHDLYIRGKVRAESENRADTESAIELLMGSIAANPSFAEAHAQLARAYNTMAFKFSSGAERKRYHELAEISIEKALTLNPNLPEGHFARGLILWTNTEGFPHDLAIQSYKRSLAIDPNQDETHHQLSLVYSHVGLLDEADQSVKRALELDPNNTLARFRVGVYLQYRGKFEEALAVFRSIPRDHTPLLMDRSLAETLIQAGQLAEAEAIVDNYLRRFPNDDGGSFTSVKALLLAKHRRPGEAEQMALRAYEIGDDFGHFHHTAYNIAATYAAIGRPNEAVKWLEKVADGGFPNYAYFSIDPNLAPLRSHPEFAALVARLKKTVDRIKAADST